MIAMLNKNLPLISVLMGVFYQRENIDLLERSVRSIQNQTYQNLELLVCDDGSTQMAFQYLTKVATQDERIHLIRGCPRTDLASKLNWCLSKAKGAYIARMDDDDWAVPFRFEKQLCALEEGPAFAFVGSNVRLWKDGHFVGVRELPQNPEVRDFLFVQPFIHPTLVFRREALLAVGGYSEDKHCLKCEDYDLLLRLYGRGFRGENIQEYLLDYSIPNTAKGNRTMGHRWNETITRYKRFRELGILPQNFLYVVKPLAVGVIPEPIAKKLKECSVIKRAGKEDKK